MKDAESAASHDTHPTPGERVAARSPDGFGGWGMRAAPAPWKGEA